MTVQAIRSVMESTSNTIRKKQVLDMQSIFSASYKEDASLIPGGDDIVIVVEASLSFFY